MSLQRQNKKKIINDPVFGFINIQSELVFDLVEHPVFQRLRRIKQLGLSFLVYPGANHSRFEHALGAMHLMQKAISVLKMKGHDITDDESEAVMVAILLHDIGHAPFSHVLENTLVGIGHEEVSLLLMEKLNTELSGKLELAIQIFTRKYKKQFLQQLVSSQLDMDRLDYLSRDSFFTGVAEGVIGIDRIISMLNVWNDQLVIDVKGIYSVEKFLIARRLMYWQVYLHKTVVSAEMLLINVLKRAKELISKGIPVYATPPLDIFLKNDFKSHNFLNKTEIDGRTVVDWFILLDDSDIQTSVKNWQFHSDPVLSYFARSITNRNLFQSKLKTKPVSDELKKNILKSITEKITENANDASYFLMTEEISNNAYNQHTEKINILFKNGKIKDLGKSSDIDFTSFSKTVRKYFISFPKELDIYDL